MATVTARGVGVGETVQSNPGAFDFDGDGEVTIFDVQTPIDEL